MLLEVAVKLPTYYKQIPFIDLNQFMNGLPPSIVNKEDLKIKRSRSNIL